MTANQQRTTRRKRLRKQPRVRRINASATMAMPSMRVPATANRRRKRNIRRLRIPNETIRSVLLSARWASLLLVVLAAGALAVIGLHEDFYVTFIPVNGVASISPEEVVAASGLAGAHVFSVDPRKVAENITKLPGVVSATVSLSWPNEVQISIREDAPVAVWLQDGQQYWVSREGALLPARLSVGGLLVIEAEGLVLSGSASTDAAETNGEAEEAEPEEGTPYLPPEILAGALELQHIKPSLTRLYYDPSGGLSFLDGSGWRAYFGSGDNIPGKMVVYDAVIADLLSRNLTPEYVSVANVEKPYYRAEGLEEDG
jgi:hypothetical protein